MRFGEGHYLAPTTAGKRSNSVIKMATLMRGIGTDVFNKRVMAVQELLLP